MTPVCRRGALLLALLLAPSVLPARGGDPKGKPVTGTDALGDPLPRQAVHRLGTQRLRHTDMVLDVTFSPDGKVIASASMDGSVRVWDRTTGKELRRAPQFHHLVGVVFSPDDSTLAIGDAHGVWMWDWRGKRTPQLFAQADKVNPGSDDSGILIVTGITCSADRKLLAWVDAGGQLCVRDVASKKDVLRFKGPKGLRTQLDGRSRALALSPDAKLLAYPLEGHAVRVWSVQTRKEVLRLDRHRDTVNTVAFSPDGRVLATGSFDGTVRLWEVASGKERLVLDDLGWCSRVVFSADGRMLATGDHDGVICLWALPEGKLLRKLQGPGNAVLSVALSPDGKTLAAVGEDEAVRRWDVATGQELNLGDGHRARIEVVAYRPDGKALLTASRDRTVRCWDGATGKLLYHVPAFDQWRLDLVLSPDGKQFATAGNGAPLRLWDAATGKPVATFDRWKGAKSLAFCQGGKVLAFTRDEKRARLLELTTGKELPSLETSKWVWFVRNSPDGKRLALVCDGRIEVWDLEACKRLWAHDVDSSEHCVAFSPDGKRLAAGNSGDRDGILIEYDAATGKPLANYRAENSRPANCVSYVSDRYLACGRDDGRIQLWEVGAKRPPLLFEGNNGPVLALAGAADGRTFLSGHADSTALLWANPHIKGR